MSEETNPQSEEEVVAEEPKLTPLQRVKAQQAAMQKARQKGVRKASGQSEANGPSDGPTQRVQIQRRSGGA